MSARIQAFTPALAGYISLLHISDEAPAVADLVAQGLAALAELRYPQFLPASERRMLEIAHRRAVV